MITIQLKAKKEENVLRFHPWIFSGAIAKIYGKPEEGDIVKVTDNKGNFLAIGHYQIGSITVRILSFTEQLINRYFWKDRLTKAYDMRKSLNLNESTKTTAYRLVHGEGDNLPGLIIDIYGNTAVMQAHSVGMHYAKDVIAELLIEIIPEVTNVYYKSSNTLPYKAPVKAIDEYLIGGGEENIAMENGIKFFPNWIEGQKTGFFIDQRDNRSLLEQYSKGRNVLNMFCYTGGFSL